MLRVLDANAILRYLLDDVADQAVEVRGVVESGQAYTYPEVLAEVVHVLHGVYEVPRPQIARQLLVFLDEISVYDREMLEMCLRLYGESSLDFVDCVLVARNSALKENVMTFDKKLGKRLITWGTGTT